MREWGVGGGCGEAASASQAQNGAGRRRLNVEGGGCTPFVFFMVAVLCKENL